MTQAWQSALAVEPKINAWEYYKHGPDFVIISTKILSTIANSFDSCGKVQGTCFIIFICQKIEPTPLMISLKKTQREGTLPKTNRWEP